MKYVLFFAVIGLGSLSAQAQNTRKLLEGQVSPEANIEQVAWISSQWKGEVWGGDIEEVWTHPHGNAMMGSFRFVSDGKAEFYEIMAITEEKGSLMLRIKHFHGSLKGWEEKDETNDFPLVAIDGNRVYFQGLTFERTNEDTMTVFVILENEQGSEEEMDFTYRRVSTLK